MLNQDLNVSETSKLTAEIHKPKQAEGYSAMFIFVCIAEYIGWYVCQVLQ